MVGEAQDQAPMQPSQPSQQGDVSHKTLMVLVVLTVLISILSTWTVLNEVSNAKFAKVTEGGSIGEVRLNVVNPVDQPEPKTPPLMGTTGQLVFEIR